MSGRVAKLLRRAAAATKRPLVDVSRQWDSAPGRQRGRMRRRWSKPIAEWRRRIAARKAEEKRTGGQP